MLCKDCPLYEFDGRRFRCPITPWHNVEDGMFQEVPGETCLYRDSHIAPLRKEILELEVQLESTRKHLAIAIDALKRCDEKSDLAGRLRFYIGQDKGTLANGLTRLEQLYRRLNKLGGRK